ncbi:hypothetical protein H0H92_011898 [Tricholoma furcatifolium]|nr:hypothetical protein H0H92_011898 [Tricholoma furcatifolium]
MIDPVNSLVQMSRQYGQRLFYQFGLHCASHQIRIILVSCVVITSLFYPALAIYTSSQPKALSIIDTFISRTTISAFDAQKDLDDLWSERHGFRIHDDAVTRAKCGVGRALRVERLLIQGHDHGGEGALNKQTLLSTLELESRLENLISGGDTPCLKRADGRCFVVSPLLFWNHDMETLASDPNILDTLDASKNVSLGGISITPQMVLARRELQEPHVAGSDFDFATYLAVTYFFPESDCIGTSEHASWMQAVRKARAQHQQPILEMQEPTLIGLEYQVDRRKPEGWSALSASLYLAYICFFAYVAWSAGKMTGVHSRLGVTLTALIEIAVSTITSLIIVFVGAENMFNLVDAVGKTPVTLSVKQRIAEGLSRAGTSNTLKVVSYNAILGVIAVFSVGAIRQFCSFAIVVLVAHWFLAHTFFLAVLSIDLQRLTLDELLRHGTGAPSIPQITKENHPKKPRSAWKKLIFTVQLLLKGRAATNLSLLMVNITSFNRYNTGVLIMVEQLLAMMATLYYATYTSTPDEQANTSSLINHHRPLSKTTAGSTKELSAWYIWKTLNPAQAPLLHLRVEMPNIVSFRSNQNLADAFWSSKKYRPRFSMRTFRPVLWLLKIMVLPIVATTTVLWGLLLYLLKDAELLEAQRDRAEPDAQDSIEDSKALETQISFSTLPRTFSSDVELIAASKDGNVVVSVGLYNEITIWRVDKQTNFSINAADVLLRTASTSSAVSTLTSVAVEINGNYCAVGTGAGVIAAWACETNDVRPLPIMSLDNISGAVTEIQFVPLKGSGLNLLATYESGVAAKWPLEGGLSMTYFSPSRRAPIIKSSLVRVHPLDQCLVAFSLDDGTLEVIDTETANPLIMQDLCVQAGDPINTASKVHACQTELGGVSRLILAAANEAGLVTLWDGSTGECISVFDEAYGRISNLRVTPVQCETCHFCGQLPLESLSIAFSVDHVVRFFRLYINDETRRCSCSRRQLRSVSSRDNLNLGRRSRSNSITSQSSQKGSVSPSIPRARLATTFEASAFPVSGHGVHSRRASEKETGRRSSDTLLVPFPGEEYDSDSRPFATPSFWRDAVLVRETDVTCERGGWGVNGSRVIGVRRKPRPQGSAQGSTAASLKLACTQGLTPATLERWELWMFDPALSRLQSSLLASLKAQPNRDRISFSSTSSSTSSSDGVPRLPFTRVSPLLAASTHVLAGFGNTVGIFNVCP